MKTPKTELDHPLKRHFPARGTELQRALMALRLEVDKSIADDIERIVSTALAVEHAHAEKLAEALRELLSGHDNLYLAHFGPKSSPRNDIAAKAARAALADWQKEAK